MASTRSHGGRAPIFLSLVAAAAVHLGFGAQAHAFELPQSTIESIQITVGQQVRAAVNGQVSGSAGVYDWRVNFDAAMAFTGPPRITCSGDPCEARFVALSRGFDFEIYLPFEITLDADGKMHNDYLPDATMSANLHKIVGTLVILPITHSKLLTFDAATADATVSFTDEGGNVDVDGLSGDFALIGSLSAGGFGFGIEGFAVGALVGFLGGNAAEDAIESEIKDAFAKALETAGEKATVALRDELAKHKNKVIGTLAAIAGVVSTL